MKREPLASLSLLAAVPLLLALVGCSDHFEPSDEAFVGRGSSPVRTAHDRATPKGFTETRASELTAQDVHALSDIISVWLTNPPEIAHAIDFHVSKLGPALAAVKTRQYANKLGELSRRYMVIAARTGESSSRTLHAQLDQCFGRYTQHDSGGSDLEMSRKLGQLARIVATPAPERAAKVQHMPWVRQFREIMQLVDSMSSLMGDTQVAVNIRQVLGRTRSLLADSARTMLIAR